MRTATQNLIDDHDEILKLIDIMEVVTHLEVPDSDDLETIVDLIRDFADGVHHQKEEQLLFPRLLERGFSKESGPVAVMLHEHTVGRNYVAGIREGIEMYRKNQRNALENIRSNMDGYIFLLRSHINKENNILFRMADQSLTARDQAELLDRFGVIESGTVNGDLHRASIDRIALLGKKYLNEYPG